MHGGITDNYNSLFLIAIGFYNIIDQIIEGQNVVERWYYTAPFFILSIVIFFIPKQKIILSYVLLIIAVISHHEAIDPNGFNSAIVFLMAYINNKKKHMIALIVFLSLSSITYKSGVELGTPSDAIILVVLYAYFFYSFYKEVLFMIQKPASEKIESLTEKENAIAKGMALGINKKKIFANIGLTESAGYDMIKKIKSKLDVNSTEEIAYKLGVSNNSKTRKQK